MKVEEKKRAIQMRKQGIAMGEIAQRLGVAKSSVSYWVRDVQLTSVQRKKLKKQSHSRIAVERRRSARLKNTDKRRNAIRKQAYIDAEQLVADPLWCVGVALYWGEGGKTQQTARISNSDPEVIRLMMLFFRKTCALPEEKFRGHVHTFEHCDEKSLEAYWSKVSDIPLKYFYKTYKKQSSASKKKRDTLPYGTFQIYVHDSDFFFRLMAWIQYLKRNEL